MIINILYIAIGKLVIVVTILISLLIIENHYTSSVEASRASGRYIIRLVYYTLDSK